MLGISSGFAIGGKLTAAITLTCILGGGVSLKPAWNRVELMRARQHAVHDALMAQRQQLQAISEQLAHLSARLPMNEADIPGVFSPLAFKTLENVYVVDWHPQNADGAVRLALDWQQVQPVMHYLRRYAVQIASLTIEPVKNRLAMTIRLHDE